MDGKQVKDAYSGASSEVKESGGREVSQDDKKQESGSESVALGDSVESGGDKWAAQQPGGTIFSSDTSGIRAGNESNETSSEVKKPTASSMEKSPGKMEVAAILLKIANTTSMYVSPKKDAEQLRKDMVKVAPATPSPLMKELSNWRTTFSSGTKRQIEDETGSEFQEHSAASDIIQAGKESNKPSSESSLKVENSTAESTESSIEKSPEKTVASILLGIANTGKHGISPKKESEQSPKGAVPSTPSPLVKQLSKWRSCSSSKKRQLEDGDGSEFQGLSEHSYASDLQNGRTPPKRNIFQRYKGKASINKQSSPAPDQSMDIDQPTSSAETPSKVLTPSRKKSRFAGLINVTLSRLNSQDSPQRRIVWTSGERAEFETFPSGTTKELDADRTEDYSLAASGLPSGGTTTKELDAGKTEDNSHSANGLPSGAITAKELDAGKTEDNPLAANEIPSGATAKQLAGKTEDNPHAANGLRSGSTAKEINMGRIKDNPIAVNGQILVDKAAVPLPVEQENI